MSVSENDKRWLVVLVATDKIVTPLLRDFVAKEIEKLSVFLKNYLQNNSKSCNLQTLTYEICSSDPNFKGLQFRNINNNKNNNDEKKTKVDYNYSINSLVDLAKLYLPDYLAKFAAFDNSMDLSAALRLMGYDSYPTQVFVSSNPSLDIKFLADDVKDVVRNPGAHYTEGTWTEDYMNQCFEKLEALVRALVLPDDQEKNTLDQLHQWNTNGWDLITGTDLHDLMKIFTLNNDRKLKFLASKFEILMERCSSLEERVSSSEKSVDSLKEQLHMEKIRLDNFMVEVCKKFKKGDGRRRN